VEAAHEVGDGGLAGSGLTDEGDDLTGLDAEGHVGERVRATTVTKRRMPQFDGAVRGPPGVRRAAVDLVRTLKDLFDPAHRVERQREVAQMRWELVCRSEEQADRPDDEDEVAGGRVAGDDVANQPPQHHSP